MLIEVINCTIYLYNSFDQKTGSLLSLITHIVRGQRDNLRVIYSTTKPTRETIVMYQSRQQKMLNKTV